MPELLERDALLDLLGTAVRQAAPVVLVAGEAGAGKSSVVAALCQSLPEGQWVVGGCDSLSTALPLKPLREWGDEPEQVLRSVRLAVVEDVHWADDATLDALAQLVRRRDEGGTLLLTYRDDEVGPGHPLGMLLGDLATRAPVRATVPRLTRAAVEELAAGTGLPVDELHRATGGNAFFVTECLATGSLDAPSNVRDAVLSRLERLPSGARQATEVVSVVPGRCELWLAEAMGADVEGIDTAVARGVLQAGDGWLALRHELARAVVEGSLLPGRRRSLHRAAAQALAEPRGGMVEHARVVHHAVLGELPELVGEHARPAADRAEAAGARSQAVAHLAVAVRHATGADLVDLWERYGEQLSLIGRDDEAVTALETAEQLALEQGDDERRGRLLARMPSPLSTLGRLEKARARVHDAVEVLERLGPSRPLALAYAQVAAQHMLAREFDQAEPWGRRALELARELDDVETLAYASVQSGVGLWMSGDEEGLARLRTGIALARQHEIPYLVGLGLSQLGSGGGEIRRYEEAVPALEEAIAWCTEHELDNRRRYASAWLGRCLLEQGRWDEAAQTLEPLLASPRTDVISRVTALTALGRLRARRGDPGSSALLDEALAIALPTGQLQRIWPVAVARAEAAWLVGRADDELPLLRRAHEQAVGVGYAWAADELALWLGLLGEPRPPIGATPRTAHDWRVLGCVYEAALVEDDELAALADFERLGAAPAARLVVERRRAAGLRVPRGPNATTRESPAGLTSRELDVLALLGEGLTNAAIAEALHLSAKTVGHHVSHILDKLGVASRVEAAILAARLGLVPADDGVR